ncbi:MAG: anti-sigma factor [Leifsonia sp.]
MSDKDPRPDGDEQSLSGSYALDAVDREERERYERALAESETLREEAAGFADTAALLGSSVPPMTPPPSLKEGIFARLDEVPQLPAIPDADQDTAVPPVAPVPAAAPGPVVAAPSTPEAPAAESSAAESSASESAATVGPREAEAQRRWFSRPVALVVSAAAAVVLIGGVVVGVGFSGPNGWGAQRQLSTIAEAPDTQQATSPVAGGGTITVQWSEELGRSAIMVEDMPALSDSQTYELWYIDGTTARSAGTFTPGADGSTWRVLDGDMTSGAAVGVTVEPAGGSEQPTTQPIVVVPTSV